MNSLKYLPWRSLCLASLLSVLGVKLADWLLTQGLQSMVNGTVLLKLLLTRPGFILLYGCAGLAIGSLGVFLLGRIEHYRAIYSTTLWALVGCLTVSLWLILGVLNVESLSLAAIDYLHFIGLMVGVFWSGKRYWR